MRCRSAPPGYKEPARTIGVFNEGDSDKAAKPVAYCRHHGAPGAGGLTPLQSAMVMGHAGRGNTRRASVSSGKASESYEEPAIPANSLVAPLFIYTKHTLGG